MQRLSSGELQVETVNDFAPTEKCLDLFRSYDRLLAEWSTSERKSEERSAEAIRQQLVSAREDAMKVYPYCCIQEFRFTEPRVTMVSYYDSIVRPRLGELNVLDYGCCMGTDLRKLLIDGARRGHVIGVDINKDFISTGFKVFGDEAILSGSMFVADLLQPEGLRADQAKNVSQAVEKIGGIDVVYAGSVLHLLPRDLTERLVEVAAAILRMPTAANKPRSKGIFFGRTACSADPEKPLEAQREAPSANDNSAVAESIEQRRAAQHQLRFLHSQATLRELLTRKGFTDISIEMTDNDVIRAARTKFNDPAWDARGFLSFCAHIDR